MARRLVVGLGNVGARYAKTRHNAGFMVADALARSLGVRFAKGSFAGETAVSEGSLIGKPHTYMNGSGSFVFEVARYFRIEPKDVLVVFDDVDLPLGEVRLRASGSSGGQKGMRDVIDRLGTDEIARLRLGVGRSELVPTADHVLSRFTPEEEAPFQEAIKRAAAVCRAYLVGGFEAARAALV